MVIKPLNIVIKDTNIILLKRNIPTYVNIITFDEYNKLNITDKNNNSFLFVGYFDIKSFLGEEKYQIIDLFDNKIEIYNLNHTNTYWCYNKEERVGSYYETIHWYIDNGLRYFLSEKNRFIYKPYNFAFKEVIESFKVENIKKVYKNKRSVFVLMDDNKTIYGFDIYYFKFIGDLTIINEILNLKNIKIINDYDNSILDDFINMVNENDVDEIIEKFIVYFIE